VRWSSISTTLLCAPLALARRPWALQIEAEAPDNMLSDVGDVLGELGAVVQRINDLKIAADVTNRVADAGAAPAQPPQGHLRRVETAHDTEAPANAPGHHDGR